MKLGGWERLWVVLSIIYGLLVFAIAFADRPTTEKIKKSWIYEAGNSMATTVSAETGQEVTGFRIVDIWERKETTDQIIARLEKIEKSPTEFQKSISPLVAEVNSKYRPQIEGFSSKLAIYIFLAFLWWLLPVFALYALGWAIGWVKAGFHQRAA